MALMIPASARQGNPDSRGAAVDYTQILHTKGPGQVVFVWWVVPETFAGAPNGQAIQDALTRNVVVGIADGRAAGPGAPMTFTPVPDLKIADAAGGQAFPLPPPPTPP